MRSDRPFWKLVKSNVPMAYASSFTDVLAAYITSANASADIWLLSITALNPLPAIAATPMAPPSLVRAPTLIPRALLKADTDLPAVSHPFWKFCTCPLAVFRSVENVPVLSRSCTTKF